MPDSPDAPALAGLMTWRARITARCTGTAFAHLTVQQVKARQRLAAARRRRSGFRRGGTNLGNNSRKRLRYVVARARLLVAGLPVRFLAGLAAVDFRTANPTPQRATAAGALAARGHNERYSAIRVVWKSGESA